MFHQPIPHAGPLNGPYPVAGTIAHKGWVLMVDQDQDGEGFWYPLFYAVGHGQRVLIKASSWNFHPTQARFNWLVDNRFPDADAIGGKGGPLTDALIDAAIARDAGVPAVDLNKLAQGAKALARMQGGRA